MILSYISTYCYRTLGNDQLDPRVIQENVYILEIIFDCGRKEDTGLAKGHS